MAIKIGAKRIVSKGVQLWKITKIKMLKETQLPLAYTKGSGCVWYSSTRHGIVYRGGPGFLNTEFLKVGDRVSASALEEKLELIKNCGDTLQLINKQLVEENKDWNGEETFII